MNPSEFYQRMINERIRSKQEEDACAYQKLRQEQSIILADKVKRENTKRLKLKYPPENIIDAEFEIIEDKE